MPERFGEPEHHGGEPFRYRVLGAPAAMSLEIVKSHGRWRIGRVVEGVFRWYGSFDEPEAALDALKDDLEREAQAVDDEDSTDEIHNN